jgi:hypothetical protein
VVYHLVLELLPFTTAHHTNNMMLEEAFQDLDHLTINRAFADG